MTNTPTFDELPAGLQAIGRPILSAIQQDTVRSVLLIGPPGVGKTMLARRLCRSIKQTEAIKPRWSVMYRLAGLQPPSTGLYIPFRAPHHTISVISLIGDGNNARPGEGALAHGGTLFLDELPKFSRMALEAVRCMYRERRVTFGPKSMLAWLPCDFVLIGAMNPCPCGYSGSKRSCSCSPDAIAQYKKRIEVLGAFDQVVELPAAKLPVKVAP